MAKVFGSEAQKEAAVELCMKTHGGRAFLHGHLFGDQVHDFLAPCIYEGEGEMLGLAFFKSLVKHHGTRFFEPVGRALQAAGIRRMQPMHPGHWWALRRAMPPYLAWLVRERLRSRPRPDFPVLPPDLAPLAEWSARELQRASLEVSGTMRKHQLRLADRQCRMSELSGRIQSCLVILATVLYAGRHTDATIQRAAQVIGQDLQRQITGRRPSDRDIRRNTELGEMLVDGSNPLLDGVAASDILMPYSTTATEN